ncbi:MAG: hypothetical protein IT514_04825 [Burkholderiales bacterium]|nr:hypothetical protein [Burkholderiales bacterium]
MLALGSRLGDVTTQGYRFPAAPEPAQPLIHVHPAKEVPGRVHHARLAVHSGCDAFLDALLELDPGAAPGGRGAWIARTRGCVEELTRWSAPRAQDGVVYGAVIEALNRLLPPDAIVTHDAGNFSGWMHRYYFFRDRQLLVAAQAGAMGFGVPAAVAASLRHPQRKAVCLVGDGGLLMTGSELATAIQHGARPLILLCNNGSYGTIRQHQEKHFPGRVVATGLRNPDFAAWARSFGARAWVIDSDREIEAVLREALAFDGAGLVEVKASLRHISAYATLSG